MGDGLFFQLLMCTGILLVGFSTLAFAEDAPAGEDFNDFPLRDLAPIVSLEGLLGGFIWTCGNLLTIPLVKRIGIGLGLSIWSAQSTIVSFVISRTNLFGLTTEKLNPLWAGYLGAALGVASLCVFSLVNLADDENILRMHSNSNTSTEEGEASTESSTEFSTPSARINNLEDSATLEALNTLDSLEVRLLQSTDTEVAIVEKNSREELEMRKRLEGLVLALCAGTLYGFQFVPETIHSHQYPVPPRQSEVVYQIRFFFSHFLGIYIAALVAFISYALASGNRPHLIEPDAILPSILSGVVWAIACMGSMIAVAEIGLGIGFPLTTNGSFLVNACWSVFYFKEVKGMRNLTLFATAGIVNFASCAFLAYSRSEML